MSAFGKKGNAGGMKPGGRPAFGVARPMKGGGRAPEQPKGGEQFPPLPADGENPNPAPSPA
ncbi:MAG: CpaF family protein, partial [Pseudomonadota bacterium]